MFLSTKFLEGAWVVVIAIPLMMWLFSHTETYYAKVASELKLGKTPGIPHARESVVIVPTSTVNLLTKQALDAALSIGDTVVAVAVAGDEEERERVKQDWDQWKCSVPLEVVIDPHRSLVRTVLDYVESIPKDDVNGDRADPRADPDQAPSRDPPQSARPAARGRPEVAQRRHRRHAAVPRQSVTGCSSHPGRPVA